MKKFAPAIGLAIALAAASCGCPSIGFAQTPEQVSQAFTDIRSDHIKGNANRALDWLYANRDALKDQMTEELYRTDRQGRDALFFVLFETETFVPDERFARAVMQRLPEENTYVKKGELMSPNLRGRVHALNETQEVHWAAWEYMSHHYDLFEPLLQEEVAGTNNVWELWATAWCFKKQGVLAAHAAWFTPEVLARAAGNLQADNTKFNATQAVRLFLLLGEQSLPTLREATTSADSQESSLARATIDALGGSRPAFGYLTSKLADLALAVYGPQPREQPEWLGAQTARYMNQDDYP